MTVDRFQARTLAAAPHGFFGRRGGVSTGAMASLNTGWGSGDDHALIDENRRRAANAVASGRNIVSVHQMHSGDCVVAGHWPDDDRPQVDALVTDRVDILLGILTADCAPVLLADVEAGVVGAAHAGWRGAFAGVTDATIAQMELLGARRERIAAAVGPCIAQRSYEVDDAFVRRFIQADPANERFFAEGRTCTLHFDLESYVVHRLAAGGLTHVEALGADTYADDQRFFSYRRATHRSEPGYGRQISLIGLPAA